MTIIPWIIIIHLSKNKIRLQENTFSDVVIGCVDDSLSMLDCGTAPYVQSINAHTASHYNMYAFLADVFIQNTLGCVVKVYKIICNMPILQSISVHI